MCCNNVGGILKTAMLVTMVMIMMMTAMMVTAQVVTMVMIMVMTAMVV